MRTINILIIPVVIASVFAFGLSSSITSPRTGATQEQNIKKQGRLFWKAPSKDKAKHRNVLLLIFEDLRFDGPGYAGGKAKTPNIDGLKEESVNFKTACTTTGLCSPSRAALMTGMFGNRTGLDDNVHVWQSRLMGLDLDKTTLLEWAREKDYFVGYFGKWHLGPDGPIRRGVHRFPDSGLERYRNPPDKPHQFELIKRYYDNSKIFEEKREYYVTTVGGYKSSPLKQKV